VFKYQRVTARSPALDTQTDTQSQTDKRPTETDAAGSKQLIIIKSESTACNSDATLSY